MSAIPPLTVLIAEDQPVTRIGLRELLQDCPELDVLEHEPVTADETIRYTLKYRPDVILLDLTLIGNGGLRACQEIKAKRPATRIIALTGDNRPETLVEAIQAGVSGYLLKTMSVGPLRATILRAARGESVVDNSMSGALLEAIRVRGLRERDTLPPIDDLEHLVEFVAKHFSRDEIVELCHDLRVDYGDINQGTQKARAWELVLYLERRERVEELKERVRELRPGYKGGG